MCRLKEGYSIEPISGHIASCLFVAGIIFCVLQRRPSLKARFWSVLQCFTVLTSDFMSSVCVQSTVDIKRTVDLRLHASVLIRSKVEGESHFATHQVSVRV